MAWPAGDCAISEGQMVSVQGEVEIQRASVVGWRQVRLGNGICAGDRVRTGRNSRAAILLANETLLRLDQQTTVTFPEIEKSEPSWLDLLKGSLYFISRTPKALTIGTPFVNAGIEGTEFAIRVGADRTDLWVYEGKVLFSNAQGKLSLGATEAAVAKAGQAPRRRTVIRPRDAVQWTLYYPPLTDFHAAARGAAAQAIQESLADDESGNVTLALARLAQVPAKHRDAAYYDFRGALLLSIGRSDEAAADFDRALALDQNNGTALAWQSLIAVTNNENEKALSLASRAASADPKSPIPQTALSYAYQASFNLDKALESAEQATRLDAQDALAWARLAELYLSKGELKQALKAAREAAARNPRVARTQSVLGFADLTRIEIQKAQAAFEKAVELDQADPLPRLGLGLAKIRKGELKEGREEIEIAAGLDPNNSLIRSYLGKAYYDEKRDPLAASQFALAKKLDPRDPTPWFYDAILEQTENRPVEALEDLQRSIELNDNRAVYRSRLLLDEDLAARGASQARIYDDIGFQQLGANEASRSLVLDPSSASAHRFLSDIYRARSRHEIARASELLQAQLLQDININPVQPSLNETDLNIAVSGGPVVPGLNEFTHLFLRNQAQLNLTGAVGNLETVASEAVVSGIYNRVSLSGGLFHFETQGFRPNNDNRHTIGNVFAQVALTPELNVQAELRRRETDQGDLELNFNPDNFSDRERRTFEQDSVRVGARYSPAPSSDFIVSYAYSSSIEDRLQFPLPSLLPSFSIETESKSQGYQVEGQYLFRQDMLNVVIGGGSTDLDRSDTISGEQDEFNTNYDNVYVYGNITFPESVTWTAGLSYDSFEESLVDVDRVNPKLGVRWDIADYVRLRAAYFGTVRRPFAINQTIEPTQVAGFNQFFDDANGSKTKRFGVGLDIGPVFDVYAGAEASSREVERPAERDDEVIFDEREEEQFRAYLYWAVMTDIAVGTEFQWDIFERKGETPLGNVPNKVDTITIPVFLRYFNPAGLFAEVRATYVRQHVDLPVSGTATTDRDDFTLFDAALGYRLPKRLGVISIEGRNLLNRKFLFQDTNFQTGEPQAPRFVPERTVMVWLNLSF